MTSPPRMYLSCLTIDDVAALEGLEREAGLNFWGEQHYRRFLGEFTEYFGCKVTVLPDQEMTGHLSGFFLARSIYEHLEILKVGVLPRYQNLGIGTQLMEAAYAEGIRRGCMRCFLEVRKSNENAIRFYLGHRFRIAGTRRDYYTNPVEDAWVMERPL
jgi:ribosomal-protein-alanine N-acetyltransferase